MRSFLKKYVDDVKTNQGISSALVSRIIMGRCFWITPLLSGMLQFPTGFPAFPPTNHLSFAVFFFLFASHLSFLYGWKFCLAIFVPPNRLTLPPPSPTPFVSFHLTAFRFLDDCNSCAPSVIRILFGREKGTSSSPPQKRKQFDVCHLEMH